MRHAPIAKPPFPYGNGREGESESERERGKGRTSQNGDSTRKTSTKKNRPPRKRYIYVFRKAVLRLLYTVRPRIGCATTETAKIEGATKTIILHNVSRIKSPRDDRMGILSPRPLFGKFKHPKRGRRYSSDQFL